jgi:DmsE family decaheme c-type cytochrome
MLFLGAAMLCATEIAAQTDEAKPNGHPVMQPVSCNLADAAACATCHKEVVKDFADNPHSRAPLTHGGKVVTCESCHGPGKAHVEGGDATTIFDPATATAKQMDEKCQACHGRPGNFERSVHGEGNVSCIGCHTIHASGAPKHLLKMEQPQLCFQCHSDVKPQFSMTFHHKVEEGLIECTDCHDAHGAFLGEETLSSSRWQFMVCTKCHMGTAGPFVYEHAAVQAEGCSACHFPHGGPDPHLLIKANVNTICLQCHLPSPNSTTGRPPEPAHILSAQSPSCISCHSSIHGSNTSEVFLRSMQGKSER